MKGIFYVLLIVIFMSQIASAAEKVEFYITDPAGTPLAITDSSGQVVWQADYKPFGEENSTTGSASNDRRFVGKEKDEETGLSYFGARYEDSKIGRFIAPDPVRAVDPSTSRTNEKLLLNPQRLNTYAYALNNPYRYVDPDGRDIWDVGFFSYSVYKFAKEPSWENAGYAGMDAVGLIPIVPALGTIARVGKGLDKAIDASKTAKEAGNAAHNAADALRLNKSLASKAQMSEVGEIMAGTGGRVPFRDSGRVAQQYGGNPTDWVKKTSSSYTARDGVKFETHWVENIKTGARVEFKTKFTGGN